MLENAAASWVCLVRRVSCRGRDRRDMAPGSWTLKHDTVTSNTALLLHVR